MWAAVLQTLAAAVVAGVCLAFLAYAFGVDRLAVRVIRHPLVSFELAWMVVASQLPPPVVRAGYQGRHAGGE